MALIDIIELGLTEDESGVDLVAELEGVLDEPFPVLDVDARNLGGGQSRLFESSWDESDVLLLFHETEKILLVDSSHVPPFKEDTREGEQKKSAGGEYDHVIESGVVVGESEVENSVGVNRQETLFFIYFFLRNELPVVEILVGVFKWQVFGHLRPRFGESVLVDENGDVD